MVRSSANLSQRILIDIAGLVVSLETDDVDVAQRIRNRYREFVEVAVAPLLVISLRVVPGAQFVSPAPGPLVIHTRYANQRLVYRSYQERGEIDLKSGRGTVEIAPSASVENFLRAVYAWLCIDNNSLMLHSAGVIREGRGYVFFGPSGAGKTTISHLAAATSTIVSDDLVIIGMSKLGYTLHGVPFKGEFSGAPRSNTSAPLCGLFRLRQGKKHGLEEVSPAQGVAGLMASSPFVSGDPGLTDALVRICHGIVDAVSVRNLQFKRDDGFWREIDERYEKVPIAAPTNGR